MYQQEKKHLSTKLFIVRAIAAAISPLIVSIITRNARLGEHAYCPTLRTNKTGRKCARRAAAHAKHGGDRHSMSLGAVHLNLPISTEGHTLLREDFVVTGTVEQFGRRSPRGQLTSAQREARSPSRRSVGTAGR